MAKTEHYYTQFESGEFYHVYNRTVDKSKLFASDNNYRFFLKKLDHYLSDYVNIYAYCLLGNHFHLMIEILSENKIKENLLLFESRNPDLILAKKSKPIAERSVHEMISHQFKKFFQSYSMAFNKEQNRNGTLFQTPFKRALVTDNQYFANLIHYIHFNPQKHGICKNFKEYEWSSYQRILIDKPSKLFKKEVLNWFGNKEEYIKFHESEVDLPDNLYLED